MFIWQSTLKRGYSSATAAIPGATAKVKAIERVNEPTAHDIDKKSEEK
jgi:enoyl reductase-like protein